MKTYRYLIKKDHENREPLRGDFQGYYWWTILLPDNPEDGLAHVAKGHDSVPYKGDDPGIVSQTGGWRTNCGFLYPSYYSAFNGSEMKYVAIEEILKFTPCKKCGGPNAVFDVYSSNVTFELGKLFTVNRKLMRDGYTPIVYQFERYLENNPPDSLKFKILAKLLG